MFEPRPLPPPERPKEASSLRPHAALFVVVAALAAAGDAAAALAIAKTTDWLGSDETVVVFSRPDASGEQPASQGRVPAASFDAAALYRDRSAGVVTIYADFDNEIPGAEAQGSGFVVSAQGHVLTNSHVITTAGIGSSDQEVEAAAEISVEFVDGERVGAQVVGWDIFSDVGVLKVDATEHLLSPVPLGTSSTVTVGEPVAAIGSPFGQASSLSVGVVSATGRSISSLTSGYSVIDAIQIDAPINRGNSGGPLFNGSGDVIGINAQIRSATGLAEGVGFAVPIDTALRSMAQLIEDGKVQYPWVGISTATLTPGVAARLGYEAERGAAIQRVYDDTPASEAGLREGDEAQILDGVPYRVGGDVVVAVDGEPISSSEDLIRILAARYRPGDEVPLRVQRGSEQVEITVLVGERPEDAPRARNA